MKNAPTDCEVIVAEKPATKVLRNGQIYIITKDGVMDLLGRILAAKP